MKRNESADYRSRCYAAHRKIHSPLIGHYKTKFAEAVKDGGTDLKTTWRFR